MKLPTELLEQLTIAIRDKDKEATSKAFSKCAFSAIQQKLEDKRKEVATSLFNKG